MWPILYMSADYSPEFNDWTNFIFNLIYPTRFESDSKFGSGRQNNTVT